MKRKPTSAFHHLPDIRSGLCRAASAGCAVATLAAAMGEPISQAPQEVMKRLTLGSDGKTPTLKEMSPEWAGQLNQRGKPFFHTRENSKDFEYIGMPVGGIGSGLLYLGGDGKLWGWDIFNTIGHGETRQEHGFKNPYARSDAKNPAYYQLDQGFAIRLQRNGQTETHTLDRDGFKDIHFRGEYPVGRVSYADASSPVKVTLEAFSPFIPLDLDASSYPATVLIYQLHNTSKETITGDLAGWLQNATYIRSGKENGAAIRHNQVSRGKGAAVLECSVGTATTAASGNRADMVFEDFEAPKYTRWKTSGSAFGDSAMPKEGLAQYMAGLNIKGNRAAISHNTRDAADPGAADAHEGSLLSDEFRISRKRIAFLIGGGEHPGKAGINLIVDGKVVASATGKNQNELRLESFDVSNLEGKKARLEIIDHVGGHWANTSVDHIVFCDNLPDPADDKLKQSVDYGTMTLTLLDPNNTAITAADFKSPDSRIDRSKTSASRPCSEAPPVGVLSMPFKLKPGAQATVRFVLAWHFPNYRGVGLATPTDRSYGERFKSAREVSEEVTAKLDDLTKQTRLWRDTWYDSSLPWWFLDRTFINTSILASNTSYLLHGKRFFGFEGEHLGYGTCTHVWGYVQAMGRLFPDLERSLREIVDFNPKVAFDANTGGIGQRGEMVRNPADDGQAGIILRTLLVHHMQPDNAFLKSNYPQVKLAMNFLVNQHDSDKDGILTGSQMNTLDAEWFGKITWISLYYNSALHAAAEMADDMNDPDSAKEWRAIANRGRKYIEEKLFNGEFFIHEADPEHPNSPGTYNGCHIDQLLGQSWAYQLGLGMVIDPAKATKALDSIWRYNFTTDIGPYREKFTGGRWFAMPGEGGFLMCSWPNGGSEALKIGHDLFAGYLNECMAGFEYAVSSLMMWHGMPERSLAHTKIMHERYDATKRNPWNEVEWGSFYSRSMASYGVFTAACGFEYRGPDGYMAFSPKLSPDRFKAAFTSAQGWGSFEQTRKNKTSQHNQIEVKWGSLRLNQLALDLPSGTKAKDVVATIGETSIKPTFRQNGNRITLAFPKPVILKAGQRLEVSLGS